MSEQEHDDIVVNDRGMAVSETAGKKGSGMELFVLAGVLVAWIVLQAFVLPKFGVST
jgi:hypothetical protein